MSLIEHILSTVAPHECLRCGREGEVLCGNCLALEPDLPARCFRCQRASADYRTCTSCRSGSPLYSVVAVKAYDGLAKEFVHRLKYARLRAGADVAAECIAIRLPALSDCIVTHAPTATSRVRERGYDQAQCIARGLATRLGLEYIPLLARAGQQRQVGKSREQRLEQLKYLFSPIRQHKIQNKHVLLIDDVITTGATLETCARTLKVAGARRVYAATFAAA